MKVWNVLMWQSQLRYFAFRHLPSKHLAKITAISHSELSSRPAVCLLSWGWWVGFTIRLKQTFLTKLYPFPFLGSHDSFFLPAHLEICRSHDNENRLYKWRECVTEFPDLYIYVRIRFPSSSFNMFPGWTASEVGDRVWSDRQSCSLSGQDEELMTKPRGRLTCTAPKTPGRDSPDPEARRWNELGKRRETNYDQLSHLIRSPPPTLKLFLWWKIITSFNK